MTSRPASALPILVSTLSLLAACSKENNIANTNNNFTTINEVTQVIGPTGGRVGPSPGGAYLDVPPGAVVTDTELTIGEIPNVSELPLPGDATPVGPVFSFEPHGETFAIDVVANVTHSAASGGSLIMLRAAAPGEPFASVPFEAVSATQAQRAAKALGVIVMAERAGAVDSGLPDGAGGAGAGGAGGGGAGGGGAGGTSGLDGGSCKDIGFACAGSADTTCCATYTCQFVVSEWLCQ